MGKRVFTFWEPRENIPGYIALCMRTWKRFLPDYEVVVLDWRNLGEYLTSWEMDAVVCKDFTLAMQSDCLRCTLLLKYGGIWMDADTILTGPIDSLIGKEGCLFIGHRESGRCFNHGAFIATDKPGSPFLLSWYSSLLPRICEARRYHRNPLLRCFFRDKWRKIRKWNYCINGIIDPLCNECGDQLGYRLVDRGEIGAMPELGMRAVPGCEQMTPAQLYQRYWFEPASGESEVSGVGGIIMLHNSWTPKRFREMPEEQFLSSNTRMAVFLRRTLEVGT